MKTLYIDVYFLINFTVDILAAFVSLRLLNIATTVKRLVFTGITGAILAILHLFLGDNKFVGILMYACFSFLVTVIACRKASASRRIKFLILFYISTFTIGGIVSYIYDLLDEHIGNALAYLDSGAENRKMLFFSLIILLVIGVFRFLIMIFSNSMGEKSVRIGICIDEKRMELDALIDSGNLVRDPMNMNPVIFIKKATAGRLFPSALLELADIDKLAYSYKKRVRLVPVTRNGATHVMTGVRVDSVCLIKEGGRSEEINATIVIDREGGTFGGYEALAPYAAICNAL